MALKKVFEKTDHDVNIDDLMASSLHAEELPSQLDILQAKIADAENSRSDWKAEGNGFLLIDSEFNVKGRWEKPGHSPSFGYNFWYQPRHKTMISSSWGAPLAFSKGFHPQHGSEGL
ncbi:selenium-binding protein 1-like isoform X2 [Amaranthus tricolor]|uniref:selenium-binding protein 1-like isoform X2 n=1 Tax=Amaranthus tricolor TaxID=29722 RepID=UPI002587001B|nr:selenium-binding protein 1-like isoform X2 [Amaranthus tricolor]